MSEFCHIATTTGSRHEAERIATELVDRRLASCVQINGPIHSTYRWQERIEHADEWQCVIKARLDRFEAVAEAIRELHPYEVPEIVATPILAGSAPYLDWMRHETK
jgi:periplasmic divalent cation tolerance protein